MGAAKGRPCPGNMDTEPSSTRHPYSNGNELGRGEPQQSLPKIAWEPLESWDVIINTRILVAFFPAFFFFFLLFMCVFIFLI